MSSCLECGHWKGGVEKAQESYLSSPPLPLPWQGLWGTGLGRRKFGLPFNIYQAARSAVQRLFSRRLRGQTLFFQMELVLSLDSAQFFSEGLRLG